MILMRTIIGRPRALGLALLAITALPAMAQSREIQRGAVVQARTARIREYRDTFPTYPFSDPDPIPVVGRIYPYFRFDGFTATARPQAWKVVELENDFIRVLILPEIGGKIWAAVEKRTGRPFIYFNHAVKFRDIAMRGPWTSGGIEANYGIIGHTPNVSTPVDYVVRKNADGSVSAIVGALDLLTNTTWRVETRLAPDQAYFTTSSTWHNGSSLEQPYYTWMTAGIPTRGDLQYVFPGTSWIGHDGEPGEWPINTARNADVSRYERNDFGPYKSYHVFGGAGDFFGAYWRDHDFGMARVAPRDEKPGQKIWIWGLSRQGMIWEQLLTDRDGQYSELQSGRLFNQSAEGSTFTPFKHRGFTPHLTDRWTERWMPVVGTKGFVTASAAGALNVTQVGDRIILALSPAEPVADSLIIQAKGQRLAARRVVRSPLQPWADTITAPGVALRDLRIILGDHRLVFDGDPATVALDRPIATPRDFDWTSAVGLHLKGKELMRQREYDRARPLLDSALAKDPHFVPALTDRAALELRAMRYEAARRDARTALSVDTYDGAANYYYGLANRHLGRVADARDGFEIASQTLEYRVAAYAELAKLWLADGDARRAAAYADKALAADPADLDALGVRVVIARRNGAPVPLSAATAALEAADPLSQLARYERLLARRAQDPARLLLSGVRAELPEQQLFQLASWYLGVGERAQAQRLLEALNDHPEALYWRAALRPANATALITRANELPPLRVFPFRPEVITALEQVVATSDDWKPRYYRALGLWHLGRLEEARPLLVELGDRPGFAPFYAARAAFPGRSTADRITDLRRAAQLDRGEWRYGKRLTEALLAAGDAAGAEAVASDYYGRIPASYILGLTLVRAQMAAGHHAAAERILDRIEIIPYEGSAEGHALYREAKLLLAVDAMRDARWEAAAALIAAAREWPERLGAGKPYPENVDERAEDLLEAELARRRGTDTAAARATRDRLEGWARAAGGADGRVVQALRRLP